MTEAYDIEVIVFDVLGTMVDEPGGLRAAMREAAPASEEASGELCVDRLLNVWQEYVRHEQRRIAEDVRPYANSEIIDREAAERVADRVGLTDAAALDRLATAGQRMKPWDDSLVGLARLAERFPVLALSDASRTSLLRLNAHAALRWHQALSAEDAQAYKPAPEVYQLALDAAGSPPERVLMVAAHAWDLRGAQAMGMRTAHVQRPVGDPPRDADSFTWRSSGLEELAAVLAGV
ncbi:haloacid dehalogenase type II [Streptomyces sp. CA-210063]|uniref:haloacid dehalogenase type II n=1 Tax=Streptomyces sp. CA-210063 TaxID=2801029 RepID=UPI00214C33C7|nr:haloacid dehalogenase type II [Streptomyces sp. CA-210063]UUU36575.1 haloacid dehalogenase type II [Streptomyces sp. CA-210063]